MVECIDLLDADGAFRHFPYPGGRREQPAADMEILRVVRQAWVRLMREDLESKYGKVHHNHQRH